MDGLAVKTRGEEGTDRMQSRQDVASSYDRQIGLRIKQARIGAGLTQKELAEQVGVKQGTISKLEIGTLELKPVLMRLIVEATGYPRAFFYEDEPMMPSPILPVPFAGQRAA